MLSAVADPFLSSSPRRRGSILLDKSFIILLDSRFRGNDPCKSLWLLYQRDVTVGSEGSLTCGPSSIYKVVLRCAGRDGENDIMRQTLAALALVCVLFVTGCVTEVERVGEPLQEAPAVIRKADRFDLQAHRGGKGRVPPGNILAAFEYALDLCVTTIELDMHATKDGAIVVIHDHRVPTEWTIDPHAAGPKPPDPRTANADELAVKGLTLDQLKRYRCELPADLDKLPGRAPGATLLTDAEYATIPTLEEVFQFCRDYASSEHKTSAQRANAMKVRFNLETKSRGFEDKVLGIVRKFGFEKRVYIQSFDHNSIVDVSRIDPAIVTAALDGVPDRIVQQTKASIWSPNHSRVNPANVQAAHDLGLLVVPWTVNDATRMKTLIEGGVDGIITDYPDVLKDILVTRGIAYAP
jgi:glycerophosphoryl diester phosphodiesterase